MYQKLKKAVAVLCLFALVVTAVPVPAEAAAKPKFAKKYTSLYENDSNKGVYTYTVQKLTKGQNVKWSVSGTGKNYVKLNKKSTKVTKTSVTNKLTVKTKGASAAKNKTVILTAKIYSKAGKLQYTLKTPAAKIKIRPTKVEIVNNAAVNGKFLIGKTYQFQYKVTPANATSVNEWIAMDEDGEILSSMTKKGAFTPKEEGNYTIAVQAKIGSKIIKSASRIVTVSNTMLGVKQTAADKIVVNYSSSAKELVKQSDFSIKNAVGASIIVKSMDFSKDGKEVMLTTQSLLKDAAQYTVTDGQMTFRFTAHIGKPERLEILTKEITVNKETAVSYALYDSNGIDVKAACKKEAVINDDYKITNGYLTKDGKIYMQKVGDTGTITMTYADQEEGILLTATGTFTCVSANTSNNTSFTLTDSEKTPDYDAAGYKDNRKAAAGQNYFAHFCARDEDLSEIKYESIQFESSDPDTLLVNNQTSGTAKVTAIKPGTVTIIVTAVYAKQEYTYSYDVTVVETPYLQGLKFDKTQIEMSNSGASGYKGYIQVHGVDQYGEDFPLVNETAQFTDNSTYKTNMVSYDAAGHQIVIDAAYRAEGVYQYALTVTMGTRKVTGNFVVVVKTPPANGAVSYQVQIDRPVLDLAVTDGMKETELVSGKTVTVRLAEYRGGVFYNYVVISSAKVTKDGISYGNDLTAAGTASVTANNQLVLTALKLDGNKCTKAQTGNYSIELKYYRPDSASGTVTITAGLQITDSQPAPAIVVKHTTAGVSCKTALDLVKDCLEVTGVTGEIVSCEITGAEKEGGSYKLATGESINIKTVTVQTEITLADGKKIVMNREVAVGRTLKNA